jgi:hypothetical protein
MSKRRRVDDEDDYDWYGDRPDDLGQYSEKDPGYGAHHERPAIDPEFKSLMKPLSVISTDLLKFLDMLIASPRMMEIIARETEETRKDRKLRVGSHSLLSAIEYYFPKTTIRCMTDMRCLLLVIEDYTVIGEEVKTAQKVHELCDAMFPDAVLYAQTEATFRGICMKIWRVQLMKDSGKTKQQAHDFVESKIRPNFLLSDLKQKIREDNAAKTLMKGLNNVTTVPEVFLLEVVQKLRKMKDSIHAKILLCMLCIGCRMSEVIAISKFSIPNVDLPSIPQTDPAKFYTTTDLITQTRVGKEKDVSKKKAKAAIARRKRAKETDEKYESDDEEEALSVSMYTVIVKPCLFISPAEFIELWRSVQQQRDAMLSEMDWWVTGEKELEDKLGDSAFTKKINDHFNPKAVKLFDNLFAGYTFRGRKTHALRKIAGNYCYLLYGQGHNQIAFLREYYKHSDLVTSLSYADVVVQPAVRTQNKSFEADVSQKLAKLQAELKEARDTMAAMQKQIDTLKTPEHVHAEEIEDSELTAAAFEKTDGTFIHYPVQKRHIIKDPAKRKEQFDHIWEELEHLGVDMSKLNSRSRFESLGFGRKLSTEFRDYKFPKN